MRLPLGRMHSLLYFHYCNPHHFHVSWLRLSAGYNTLSTPVGEVGFEPTHHFGTGLQPAATLQLRRSPLLTPYRPTNKTCQIFSFPLKGNMLYRHLHQKVFWTGVYFVSQRSLTPCISGNQGFWRLRLSPLFHFLYFIHGLGNNKLTNFHPLSGRVLCVTLITYALILLTHRELSSGLVAQIPRDGFEPSTCRLWSGCSTTELPRHSIFI